MQSRKPGRLPADSRPEFDGIDVDHALSGSSRSSEQGQASCDSHVLVGANHKSTTGSSSALALLNGQHRSDSGSGFPSSLNLHLTEPQTHSAPPISRGHRKSAEVPSASTTVSSDKRRSMAMTLLASYASAVTLACLYLIML
ncbi:MAG: hypothetical protein KDA52_12840, partial [Planctomycetaceae bacterium]|nr:hypothetical protein [Planctomycetaceae bacterium]